MRLWIRWLIAAFGIAILCWGALRSFVPRSQPPGSYIVDDKAVYLFPHMRGPHDLTQVALPDPPPLARYATGSISRLAILLTDPDSAWLGLAHGLKAIGIPFNIYQDYRKALRHTVVLVYPRISGKYLSAEALQALARFPREGGILIGQHVLGGDLHEVFGFAETVPTYSTRLHFDTRHPASAEFTEPEESTIRLGMDAETATRGMYAFTAPKNPPIATYEDGTAAIIWKPYASGVAYTIGVDLGYVILKSHNARQSVTSSSTYANGFAPSLDVLLRFVKNIYVLHNPHAVTLGTVPYGKALAVVLTHDVDYTHSVINALEYATFEHEQQIAATYFIQTKYVRDWNDDIFFHAEGVSHFNTLKGLGMELGSHSVAHSYTFSKFALGTGDEQYPSYRPFVKERFTTLNGTVLGELRVSRFLLESLLDQQRTWSFRPGHLQNPFCLPEALAATGYRFSSSMTANHAMTHLPFQMNYARETHAEVGVYEFPITIEDELTPPMLDRLPQAIRLSQQIGRYGGLFVILIHPDITGQKLEFERQFVAATRHTAWYGPLGELGAWWSARDRVEADVVEADGQLALELHTPAPLNGLTVTIPARWGLAGTEPPTLAVRQDANRLIFERLEHQTRVALVRVP